MQEGSGDVKDEVKVFIYINNILFYVLSLRMRLNRQ